MSEQDAPWLAVARRYIGEKEIPGSDHNPKIVGMFNRVVGKDMPDETAWCAAYVGYCLMGAGFPSTGMLTARSYLNYGQRIDRPYVGCIVVFARGKEAWMGHVGFVVKIDGERLYVLGGNQKNSVSIVPFRASEALGFIWPEAAAFAAPLKPRVDMKFAQDRLRAHGYLELGEAKGIGGSRTDAALLAFKNDRGLPTTTDLDTETLVALAEEPVPRPGTLERELATEEDLREKGSETVGIGDKLRTIGKTVAVGGGGAATIEKTGTFESLKETAQEVTAWHYIIDGLGRFGAMLADNWLLLLVVGGIAAWYFGSRVIQIRLRDHRTGAHTGR